MSDKNSQPSPKPDDSGKVIKSYTPPPPPPPAKPQSQPKPSTEKPKTPPKG